MTVTIKDVAREAAVSTATVSKVINHVPSISEATAERVIRVMKQLNYHPNLRAQNFARRSTRNIIFVTNMERNTAFLNPHMFEIMSGLQFTLHSKNYTLSLLNVNPEELHEIDQLITQNCADAMVIHASVITKEMSLRIREAGFPYIVIGRPGFENQLCWIDNNNYLSGEIAAYHLLDQGYHRLSFVGGVKKDMISTNRLIGVATALSDKKTELKEEYIKQGESTIRDGYRMMEELLSLKVPPDSVICANNHIALGVIKAITRHHICIPKEIGVITFDDYPFSQITDPMLTVVNIDVYDLGVQAGKLILSKMKKPNLQVQSYSTLPSLIIRESTRRHG